MTLLALFVPTLARAEAHHEGKLSSLNLGIRYSSLLENRGVVFYRDFQIDPVVGIFMFDDRLEYLGDSLGYRDFVYADKVRLRTRFVSISDNPLFPANDSVSRSLPDRPDTYEWNTRAEIFLPGYNDRYLAELDIGYSKDISIHHGNYFEVLAKVKMFDFEVPLSGSQVELNAFGSLGGGDTAHNQYFYGPTADRSGLNNFSIGLWFAFPQDADRFYPIIQLTHFEVLGDGNRSASYARERADAWLFSFIATVGVLE